MDDSDKESVDSSFTEYPELYHQETPSDDFDDFDDRVNDYAGFYFDDNDSD